jgi:hypothetical protein
MAQKQAPKHPGDVFEAALNFLLSDCNLHLLDSGIKTNIGLVPDEAMSGVRGGNQTSRLVTALIAWASMATAQYAPVAGVCTVEQRSSCTMACCRSCAAASGPQIVPNQESTCQEDSGRCAVNGPCRRISQAGALEPLPKTALDIPATPQAPESERGENARQCVSELPGFYPPVLRPPLSHTV